MSQAWALAEALLERRIDGDPGARLECISFHQLRRAAKLTLYKGAANRVA